MKRRIIVMALAIILALCLAAPLAYAQASHKQHQKNNASQSTSTQGNQTQGGTTNNANQDANSQDLANLTGTWWNWAVKNPSPLDGKYTDGAQCDGSNPSGVWFLGGSFGQKPVARTCTNVPANTPILFPVVNVFCSKAPTVQQPDGTFTGDPPPYTKCAKQIIDGALAEGSTKFATLENTTTHEKTELAKERVASGNFQLTFPDHNFFASVPAGTYPAASDGLWVYQPKGLAAGQYTLTFGGEFNGFKQNVTYHLTVK